MAYTTINKSTDYFNTKLYTGTGSSLALTGVGFQPDLTWIKNRTAGSGADHIWTDSVRGVTKSLNSNDNSADDTISNALTAFGTDGFTVGGNGATGASGDTYAAWNWKAGTTSGLTTNGTTTITPTSYSFNSTAGFSILKYTGNGAAGAYVAHGLGTTPAMIIVKKLSGSAGWFVYHQKLQSTYNIYLNTNDAEFGGAYVYSPDATNFRLRDHNDVNQNGETYVAYCFVEKTGYSKFGKYIGNGNANGTFVYTGFKPAFIMVKRYDGTGLSWRFFDSKRNYNGDREFMYANLTDLEVGGDNMDFLSNGFKNRNTSGHQNGNSDDYIYMAFGQSLVGTNNIPATAR